MNATQSANESLDLRRLLKKLWRYRLWVAGTVLVFGISAVVFALKSERIYRATIVVAPAASGGGGALGSALGQMSGLASLAGISIGTSGADTEEALAVLHSRDFTLRFFDSHDVVRKIYSDRWDAQNKRWKPNGNPPSVSRAFDRFDNDIRTVIQNRKTGLVTVQIDWRDRREAAEWANDLVSLLNSEMRARAISETNASLKYLQGELQGTFDVATRDSINRLIEAQVKKRMMANVNQDYAFRVVDRAAIPEADEAVAPRRVRIVIIGVLLGLFLSAMMVILVDYLRESEE